MDRTASSENKNTIQAIFIPDGKQSGMSTLKATTQKIDPKKIVGQQRKIGDNNKAKKEDVLGEDGKKLTKKQLRERKKAEKKRKKALKKAQQGGKGGPGAKGGAAKRNDRMLVKNAQLLCKPGKGILAADESIGTIGKRFKMINDKFPEAGVENTEENRRKYRALLVTTPNLNKFISGVILFEESTGHTTKVGKRDVQLIRVLQKNKILAGIKVDKG